MMVSRAGMARTSWRMCVLDRAQKIKSAVGGCGGEADVETHCVRYYSLMERKSVNRTSFTLYTCAPLHQGNLLVKSSNVFARKCDILLLAMICNAGYPIDLPTASEGSTALPSFITVAPVFHAIIIANPLFQIYF